MYRNLAVSKALTQVGVKESPAGTNRGPMVDTYEAVTGAYGEPWCASFVQWCLKEVGAPPSFGKSAYVPFFVGLSKTLEWQVPLAEVRPGDLACYDWNHDGTADHIGWVLATPDKSGGFQAVEGNTGIGNDSNGGEVMVRDRNASAVQAFIRIPGGPPAPKPAPVVPVVTKPVVLPVQTGAPTAALDPYLGMLPMWAWFKWKDSKETLPRPNVPAKIPASWWVRYKLHIR